MGTGQHRASEHITDPSPQLWGLWRNLHLSPRPVLGSRAGHIPCPPTPSVSNSPKPRQEGGSTSSPPFSANWCQAQQHKGPLSPSVLPLTLWHLQSASLPGMSAGAAGSCLQPGVNLCWHYPSQAGMSKWVATASQKQALDCFSACWRREERRGRGG